MARPKHNIKILLFYTPLEHFGGGGEGGIELQDF